MATHPRDHRFIERRTRDFTLPDGARVTLRPIVPGDRSVLVEGFERLSEQSRYRRFMGSMARLTSSQLRYLTEVDYVNHFAWVAFMPDEHGQPGVGVARYVRLPEDPANAEAAVAVIDDYHGRGIGTLLLDVLGEVALVNGVRTFSGFLLADNVPMREMLRHLGARIERATGTELRFELDLCAVDDELKKTPLYDVLRAVARGEVEAPTPRYTATLKHMPAPLDGR